MRNYRLFLFKPTAISYNVDWTSSTYRELLLGELKVDNLTTSIKLQDISTINFDLPETIFGELNTRIDEVLDNYIVELWYGDISSYSTATINRFIITKLPLEYNDGVKKYCYEGNSIEYSLEFQQLSNWNGVQVKDFYRTIRYDYENNRFTETGATGSPTPLYSIMSSSYSSGGEDIPVQYITVFTTTAGTTPPAPLDIFIYQYRRNDTDTLNSESSLIEYEQNVPSGTLYQNTSGFKPGFYVPVVNASGKVTSINIALPKDFRQFNSASKVLEFFLYDNPTSRHFAIGINTDEEIQSSDMYLDLAQDKPKKFNVTCDVVQNTNTIIGRRSNLAQSIFVGQKVVSSGVINGTVVTSIERLSVNTSKITISNNYTGVTGTRPIAFESLNAAEYGAFAFTPQLIYSINGLKLAHILNGNVENSTITEDGVLYDTNFTIGTIHNDIAAKYRSNIQLNNVSKYEAIKNLAESFDAIVIYDSVNRTVSFYPDKNEEVFTNNGLIITKENYLKGLKNDIDSSKIITRAYAAGKDNLPITLITPNGNEAWEDYSYFLDRYYVQFPAASGVTIANDDVNDINNNTGVKYTSFPTGDLSRWMEPAEALKIAKWQYARDYFHDIMLNDNIPSVAEHARYQNLYNLRSEAINNFVKEESKYFELKATEYKYKYLYDFYVKQNDNDDINTRQKTFVYKFSNSTTASDPGSTYFRLNNATFADVTEIYIDNIDNSNTNRNAFLSSISTNNNPIIVLADVADVNNLEPTNYIIYQVNSATNSTGYVTISVTYLNKTQSGTTFTNNNTINIKFNTWEEVYEDKHDDAVFASTTELNNLNALHYELYNSRFDGTTAEVGDSDYSTLLAIQEDSFATKIGEVQGFLNKSRWSIVENKLKPFIKEAVMSDSSLDNELDLLTTTREYLVENSRPIVTLSIDVIDFLSSIQSSVDWNKVKIGELVNIYFPDFNIDTTAQLKEITIDFQANNLNFTISTYRQYTRLPMTYIMRQIRRSYDHQTNKSAYQYDKNFAGSRRANIVNNKLTKVGFAAENAPIKLGAKSPDGSTSTEISGEGIVSKVIEVNPILETFIYKNEKSLQIADGTLTARNLVRDESDVLLYTTEVEVSGDNGFVIRKINTNGAVTPQVYIDTNGNAVFAGELSAATGTFSGSLSVGSDAYNQVVALAGAGTTVFKAGTIEQFQAITTANLNDLLLITSNFTDTAPNPDRDYIKDDIYRYDLITAPSTYDWVLAADLKTKITGSVGGWTIDSTSIRSSGFILQNHISNPYLSINQGESVGWYNPDADPVSIKYGIFLGYDENEPRMSLASATNYLVWDGDNLKLKGNLAGEISAINIYKVVDDVPDTAIGVRITSDGILGENTGLRSFELRAFDGRGQIAGWNFDSNNITSETNKVQLQKEGKILVGGSTIDGNGDVNNATLIIDGTATGASPVLDHDKFELRADGSAIFSGALQAATGTFGAVSIASSGSGGSLTVGTKISINNTDGIKGNDGTNTTFQLNPDNGSGFIGGFNFSNEQLSATNVILRGGATPVLSFNQATPSSGSAGIYLGMYSTGPGTVGNALSLVNPAGTRYIKYRSGGGLDSAGNLEIKSTNFELTNDGNLFATSGVVGPLSLNNVTSSSTISFDSNNYTASGTINVISDSGSFSSSRRYTFINSPDINTRPFNISNFSVTYTTSGTYSGYWTLYAYVSYGTNIIKTYSRQSGNGTFTWSVTGVNTVATNILLVLEKIGGASLTFSVTNLVGVRFLPSMSLENFAVYPSGTAFSNLFQTKDLGIIDNNIETQDTFLNLKVTPTSLGGGGVSILHTNTIRDGILIQPNINFGTSSRRVTLSTPSLALTASRTIRFPDADGTLKLNAVYIADYSVGSNTYTTAAAALSSEWMMIELYRPSASNAKVYTFFVRVADVSLSDNTTLYSYSWGEPSDGPYKDTVTLLRAGTALAPTIAIKTNAGGTTTFRFYRNII